MVAIVREGPEQSRKYYHIVVRVSQHFLHQAQVHNISSEVTELHASLVRSDSLDSWVI